MNKADVFDVVIIGAGPGGLTCAVYASRAGLKVLFVEKGAPGGKMTSTFKIDNWTGTKEIKGYELSKQMLEHAKSCGAEYKYGNVVDINNISDFEKEVILENGEIIRSKTIVIASGMIERKPQDVKNIDKFLNLGVSYCVICDGPFYKNKPAAIIGGGNSAFEEAIYLSSLASDVNIYIKGNKIDAEEIIQKKVNEIKNINIFLNSSVIELIGDDKLEEIKVNINGKEKIVKINHLYPYIGHVPIASFANKFDIFDQNGFILTNENMETKIKGIYAIGDIRSKTIRQIVTAASDGAIAAKNIANEIK